MCFKKGSFVIHLDIAEIRTQKIIDMHDLQKIYGKKNIEQFLMKIIKYSNDRYKYLYSH